MFVGIGFPYFYGLRPTSYDPRPKDQDLLDGLVGGVSSIKLCDQASSLEDPQASRLVGLQTAPCDENSVTIRVGGGDGFGATWATQKDQIQASA